MFNVELTFTALVSRNSAFVLVVLCIVISSGVFFSEQLPLVVKLGWFLFLAASIFFAIGDIAATGFFGEFMIVSTMDERIGFEEVPFLRTPLVVAVCF